MMSLVSSPILALPPAQSLERLTTGLKLARRRMEIGISAPILAKRAKPLRMRVERRRTRKPMILSMNLRLVASTSPPSQGARRSTVNGICGRRKAERDSPANKSKLPTRPRQRKRKSTLPGIAASSERMACLTRGPI